jgi:hypothetical protein
MTKSVYHQLLMDSINNNEDEDETPEKGLLEVCEQDKESVVRVSKNLLGNPGITANGPLGDGLHSGDKKKKKKKSKTK